MHKSTIYNFLNQGLSIVCIKESTGEIAGYNILRCVEKEGYRTELTEVVNKNKI